MSRSVTKIQQKINAECVGIKNTISSFLREGKEHDDDVADGVPQDRRRRSHQQVAAVHSLMGVTRTRPPCQDPNLFFGLTRITNVERAQNTRTFSNCCGRPKPLRELLIGRNWIIACRCRVSRESFSVTVCERSRSDDDSLEISSLFDGVDDQRTNKTGKSPRQFVFSPEQQVKPNTAHKFLI